MSITITEFTRLLKRIKDLEAEVERLTGERDRQYDENVNRIAAEGAAVLRMEKAEKERDALREALKASDALIVEAQGILSMHLEPDGTDSNTVTQLLLLLDGPEQRTIQARTRAALEANGQTKV